MWRQLLTAILLLVMIGATGEVAPTSETAEEINFFLPLVENSLPQIEVVVTERFNGPCLNCYNIISGYVRNQSADPYYSVTLEVDVIYSPYCDPSDPDPNCGPSIGKLSVSPTFTATLPDQINPFGHSNLCWKSCIYYYDVRVVSASRIAPNGEVYYPLTVVSWDYIGESEYEGTLSGTIRNDSNHTLQNLRLVVAELEKCVWREAEIADTILKPHRTTTFHLEIYKACLGDNLVIVGQGTVQQ